MIYNFKIVRIDSKYCDYLRNFDNKVSYNSGCKKNRPFIGVLFNIENIKYFAPLSSPKIKHLKMKNTIDFFKLDNGKLGAINFNNMIPVTEKNYELINLNISDLNTDENKYKKLLREQLDFMNKNYTQISSKSLKLYKYYNSNHLSDNIKKRCCNFKLLEEKCKEYNS